MLPIKEIRIGLLWHAFGWPNLGVDALSRSNLAVMRLACAKEGVKPHFVLLGRAGTDHPAEDDIEQGPYLRVRELFSKRMQTYFKAVKRCDLIVDICAGDGFADIYGGYLFMLHAMTKWAVISCGKPLILAPQTIGPFDSPWMRSIARWIINHSTMVFTRDGMSTEACNALKTHTAVQEVIDVAFSLPFIAVEKCATKLRIGINISGLLYYHADRFDLTIDYRQLMRRFILELKTLPNVEIWLVPHVVHHESSTECDDSATLDIANQFPEVRIAPRFRNAVEAKSFISGLDFFTGGRMHACIGAFSSGVPVIPIAYSRKFTGLFSTLNYEYLIDGRKDSTDEALQKLLDGLAVRATISVSLARGMAQARQRLSCYEVAVRHLVAEAAG